MESETVATLAVCTQHDAKSATSEVAHDHSSDGHVHRILRTVSCEDHDWQTTEPAVEFTCTCSFPQCRQSSSTARGSADRKVYPCGPEKTPPRHPVARRCQPIEAKGSSKPRLRYADTQTPPPRHPVARRRREYQLPPTMLYRGGAEPSHHAEDFGHPRHHHHDTQSPGGGSR